MFEFERGVEAVERSRAVLPWRELSVSAVCDRVRRCRPSDVDETTSPRSILQTRFECRASHRHSPAAGPLSRAARILHIVLGTLPALKAVVPVRGAAPVRAALQVLVVHLVVVEVRHVERAADGRHARRRQLAAEERREVDDRKARLRRGEGEAQRIAQNCARIAPNCARIAPNCARIALAFRLISAADGRRKGSCISTESSSSRVSRDTDSSPGIT